MDERTIRAMLQFKADTSGTDEAKKNIHGLAAEFARLEQRAKDVQVAIDIRQRGNMGYDDLTDKLKDLQAQMKATSEAAKKLKKDAREALMQSGERLQMAGGNIRQAGQGMLMTGGAVLGAAFMSAKGFVDKNPQDAIAQKWLESTKQIESSYDRIGKVMAQTLLPVMEAAARISDKLAGFVEKNPGAVQAILSSAAVLAGAGGGLMAVGTLISAAGSVMKTISAVQALFSEGGALAGIGAKLGSVAWGGVAGVGAAVGGGALIGAGAYDAFARANGLTNLGQFAAVAANSLGKLTDSIGLTKNAATDWFLATSRATNATDAQTQAALDAANALNQIKPVTTSIGGQAGGLSPDERQELNDSERARPLYEQNFARGLEMFIDFQEREVEYQAQYDERRLQMIADANAAALQAQLDYTDQRGKIITEFGKQQAKEAADFAKSEQQTEAAYYAARLRSARDFGQEVLQAEEDHQRDMRYAAEDYQDQVTELAGQNDAYGLVKAARAYEKERRRNEDEYQTEVRRKNAQYAQTLKDEEDAFRQERDQRLQAFQERQRDAAADNQARLKEFDDNFQAEQAKRKTHNQTRLDDLAAQFDKEQKKRADDFKNRLTDLDASLTGETAVRRKFYDLSAKDFKAYLQAIVAGKPYKPSSEFESFLTGKPAPTTTGSGGGGTIKAEAAGGYAYGPGLYLRGEAGYEYTLSNATTRAAEDALGGRITSASLVAALRRTQGGGGLNISLGGISITGGSPENMARQVLDRLYVELVPVFQRAAAA